MKTFLQYVAEDLIGKFGTDLSRVTVVFPNKRASLFLNEYLARLSDRPIWSPAYVTISDLFRQQTELQVADPIKLVCDLHRCFIRQTGIDETLDHFYGWGQVLLADFDDIDKNMADADKVLANLRDIHELDDLSYLSEEQQDALRRFFSNFSEEHNTELKQRFLKLWSHMADIYHDFNQTLRQQGLAYEGALYREVIEEREKRREERGEGKEKRGKRREERERTYVFVGFNLLQRVEQQFFLQLKREGQARFYWDFDHYYMKNNEAGHYISQHLADFPNELNTDDADIYRRFSQQKDVTFISAPTENIQARYISQWLRPPVAANRNTAIVLCNEALLTTVIHCLPDKVEKVNITTGYPLSQSPAASFVNLLLALQTTGYATQRDRYRLRQVNAVLRHPYAINISEETPCLLKLLNDQKIYYPDRTILAPDEGCGLLFTPTTNNLELLTWLCELMQRVANPQRSVNNSDLPLDSISSPTSNNDPLFQESVFRIYTLLNRLRTLVESGDLQVDVITLQRLIGQLIGTTSVPFHGEPIEGLQVMGVLETRNLDFDNVLLLSCNEGNMPRGVNDTSFIPYSLRKAYGLTTIDHKVSIYSYYFHRLLQRASHVTILYNNATTDGQRGEMSRFMLQLMAESPHPIQFRTLQASQRTNLFQPPTVEKSQEVMERLLQRFSIEHRTEHDDSSPLLTPTAINRYLRCQLAFYYNYACGLKEPEETEDDTIDNRIFGNIFHEAARLLYTQMGPQIVRSELQGLLKSKIEIERAIDQAFRTELFQIHDPHAHFRMELNGLQIINREVIIHYVRQLLELDSRLTPFDIVGIECDVVGPLRTPHLTTTIGGRIDRLDCVDGGLRVIDYKTGSHRLKALPDVDAVFQQDYLSKHSDYYLQTLIYSCLVRSSAQYNPQALPVSPALLFIQHAAADDYSPVLAFGKEPIDDVQTCRRRFGELLVQTVDEMFNPDLPFQPTTDMQRCKSCPYRLLCSQ